MQLLRVRLLALVLALSFGLLACSDDGPAASGDQLNPEEAEVMLEALVEAGGFGLGALSMMGSPSAGIAASTQFDISETVPCPEGGSIAMDGSVSVDEGQETMEWTFTQTHQSCQVSAPDDGSGWLFDGSPSVVSSFAMVFSETQFSMQGSEEGGIAWETGGRSGTCSIDVSYDFSGTESTLTGTVSGTVCGNDISFSETVDI